MTDIPTIPVERLATMMPMHLLIDSAGVIRSCGTTLRKLIGSTRNVQTAFELRRSSPGTEMLDMLTEAAASGTRVFLGLQGSSLPSLRGEAVLLAQGDLLLNLGFGIGVIEAIGIYNLTDADFSANELAIEIMYLHKASQAIRGELSRHSLSLEEARRTAEMQAFTDPLTGLLNRRGFEMALRSVIESRSRPDGQRQEFAVLQIDLDRFKEVNDRFGHAAGDEVLHRTAERLKDVLRDEDRIARVGGDEFTVILPGASCAETLEQIGERIIAATQQPVRFQQHLCRISASIGGIMSRQLGQLDANRMLAEADTALYAAKNAGKGCIRLYQGGRSDQSEKRNAKEA
ncbi:GGDEF domain-containing protein [Paracoccus aerodenitrificans]|uniref:GGDEF domain-containing protein n=1 Tax=Paracoccus aerodenitrificans TaxID=3017781 RepID=UPI0022F0EB32|nr:GGDEF domain-containing protein [Paracoccus aerodenitrificans]WBU65526.1 GGDEF domain-containing protein [Paracoccus aerodenitrificans]